MMPFPPTTNAGRVLVMSRNKSINASTLVFLSLTIGVIFSSYTDANAAPVENGRIAFATDRTGNSEIYTMNPNGTDLRNLTNLNGVDASPSWSPDGQKIVFSSIVGGYSNIFVMNNDGTDRINLTNFTDGSEGFPSYSPDGTKILFHRYYTQPSVEPSDIYVMNANGTGLIQLTSDPASDEDASWSPDGSKIVFESTRGGAGYDVYTMNSNGTGVVRLTNSPSFDGSASWSPDGTKIAFTNGGDIYTMNPNGTGVTQLTNNGNNNVGAKWSPDGTKIAYYAVSNSNFEIFSMDPDGNNKTNLTNDPADDTGPAFGPNTPPTCAIGGPYVAECDGAVTQVPLDGSGSSDAEGSITYLWVTDCPGTLTDAGTATPNLEADTSVAQCPLSCSATLTVTDDVGTSTTCSTTVSIDDTVPPDIVCPADLSVQCVADVPPCDASLAIATDDCDDAPTVTCLADVDSGGSGCANDPRIITRSYRAKDACGNITTCVQTITVADTTPPTVSCDVGADVLWPPNHKFEDVGLSTDVDDSCDADPTIAIAVTSDEHPANALGAGGKDKCPDAIIGPDQSVQLRAERAGPGDGRVYRITETATDFCGNSASCSVNVTVLPNQGNETTTDSGQLFDATSCP